jgi:hypothetical protein
MSAHKILRCVSVVSAGALAALALSSGAQAGAAPMRHNPRPVACPVNVTTLHAGGPEVITHGKLTQARSSCEYRFHAQRGEKLEWDVTGAATRQVITDPSGDGEGPGFANPYPLTKTGEYKLDISADLMAEGAFGDYTLHLRLKH